MEKRKKKILFVVEGAGREIGIFNNLSNVFFSHNSDVIAIPIPAGMNIYMLYNVMEKDGFETDVVEVLREKVVIAKEILKPYKRDDFAEIYFFFDFDEHSNNLAEGDNIAALKKMLGVFDNETELGKLYISYPMVEALRDFKGGSCQTNTLSCFRARDDFSSYKADSSNDPKTNAIKAYDYPTWMDIVANYVYRGACLFKISFLERDSFVEKISPLSIFESQMEIYSQNNEVFILSSLPEFLIDYSSKYWHGAVGNRKTPIHPKNCQRKLALIRSTI